MIQLRYRALAGITVLAIAFANSCGATGKGSGGENGTPLPDGKVTSKTYKPNKKTWEVCVHPEGAPTKLVKCHDGFLKEEIASCDPGDFWPECYHLVIKKGEFE